LPKVKLQKHTMSLRAGDYRRISEVFANKDLKAAKVIRLLVSQFVNNINAKAEEADFEADGEIDKEVKL